MQDLGLGYRRNHLLHSKLHSSEEIGDSSNMQCVVGELKEIKKSIGNKENKPSAESFTAETMETLRKLRTQKFSAATRLNALKIRNTPRKLMSVPLLIL